MNWLTNFIRPKIRSFVEQKEMPDNLWQKCPSCEGMLFHRELADNMNVCHHCQHHLKIGVQDRLKLIFDGGQFHDAAVAKVTFDPLKFKDRKKYADRLRETRAKTGRQDAIVVAQGTIGGLKLVVAAFDFEFMGGSMGAGVGEGIVLAAEIAVREKAALLVIPASGGARMQEGAISLMQMPRTIVAVDQVKAARLPYIVLLTDPTTGGVSASFAMVGDIHIAEPGAMIGFAGKRVIQETIREALPADFQTAEYLLEHGMIDMVTHRKDLRDTLIRILGILFQKQAGDDRAGNDRGFSRKGAPAAAGTAGRANGRALKASAFVKPGKKDKKPANTNGPATPARDAAAAAEGKGKPARAKRSAAAR